MTTKEPMLDSLRYSAIARFLRSRFAMVLCVPVLGAVSVAWARVGARGAEAASLYFPGDTTIVFGPDSNKTNNGHKTTHVEAIAITPVAGKQYTLRLKRIGTGNLNQGTVTLNHRELTDKKDFPTSGTVVNLPIKLVGADTLVVEVDGSTTDGLVVWILANTDATVPIYAATYTKTGGSKFDSTATFIRTATTGAPAFLYVNAKPGTGFNRATAEISLNGEKIVEDKDDDFSTDVQAFAVPVTLRSGTNTIRVIERGTNPARFSLEVRATTKLPPVLTISAPAPNLITKNTSIAVTGTVTDATSVTVTVNGVVAALGAGSSYSTTVPLASEGNNVITVHAVNAAGLATDSTRTVKRDTQLPALLMSSPADQLLTNGDSVTVSGTVTDANALTLTVQGVPVIVVNGAFSTKVALNEGPNFILVTATDAATNTVTLTRQVNRDKTPPVVAVTSPANGATTSDATIAVTGTVGDASAVTVKVNGNAVTLAGGAFSTTAALATGANNITVVATDAAANVTTVTRSVTRTSSGVTATPMTEILGTDATIGAPVLNVRVSAPPALANAFLYSGASPIQVGVVAGAIDSVRSGVVRGRVTDRSGQPVAGVNVSVAGHPELGHTATRANGLYDLVVNAGGAVTLSYTKSGFLSLQRTVPMQWQEMRGLDDVSLTPLSTAVTAVSFVQPIEVAQGSVETDANGSRRATMLFRQGTVATLVLPNGTTQSASTLHVRATEYTVGSNGRQAMPGQLPPTSAYTYAVELSADEALPSDATVRFSKPVALYVDNFLGFRVGSGVPSGYYDRAKSLWIPSPNGRVIRILAISAGSATVDTDGDGLADSNATLDSLGIDAPERATLAQQFLVGSSLWRVTIDHFTPWDLNWARDRFSRSQAGRGRPSSERAEQNCCIDSGSVIEVENQQLRESIPVQGAPFILTYSTSRQEGFRARQVIRIPITGPDEPVEIVRHEVTVNIAGRTFRQVLAPAPNLHVDVLWDGKDAYGRDIPSAVADVWRTDVVREYYLEPPPGSGFGRFCEPLVPGATGCLASLVPTRAFEIPATDLTSVTLTRGNTVAAPIGGWDISAVHRYDPVARTLHLGSGDRIDATSAVTVGRKRLAGTGGSGNLGDGGQAINATFSSVAAIVAAPDGSVYFADSTENVVRRIGRDGIISRVAGTGNAGLGTAGGAATSTDLSAPSGVALDLSGQLLISDSGNDRILRLEANGTLSLVAGGNGAGFSGDNDLATGAMLGNPGRLALTTGGTIIVHDRTNARLRELTADGLIHTLAGGGQDPSCGADSIAASVSCLGQLRAFTPMSDGRVAIASDSRVRVIEPGGKIYTIGGANQLQGCNAYAAFNGVDAQLTGFCPTDLTESRDGFLITTEGFGTFMRRISPTGKVSVLLTCEPDQATTFNRVAAGRANFSRSAPRDRQNVTITNPDGGCNHVVSGPSGEVFVASAHVIERDDRLLAGFANAAIRIASSDGAEVYEFNLEGRHLRTLDALTLAPLLTFQYDSVGRVLSMTDVDANVTSIERDGAGNPSAIVSPYGERTTLALDGAGKLASVSNPNAEHVTLTYGSIGLLASISDANRNLTRFTYDSLGRLTREDNPISGFLGYSRRLTDAGDTVIVTDALGRSRRVAVTGSDAENKTRQVVGADGLVGSRDESSAGVTTVTTPDSSRVRTQTVGDPQWGAHVRQAGSSAVTLPSGATASVQYGRSIELADKTDPSTLVSSRDTLVVAGQTFRGAYTAATRSFVTTSPEGRTSTMQLDANGRVTQAATAGLAPINYAYDSRGRLASVAQGDRSESYAYNAQGRLASVTDPLNRVTSFAYDASGRVTSELLPGGRTVGFSFDSTGNLTSLTPPGKPAHTFSYNGANLPTSYQAPTVPGSTGTTRYAYSPQKELVSLTRPDSQAVSIGYDAAGRPNVVTTAEGAHGIGYSATTGQVTTLSAPHGVAQSLRYDGALPTGMSFSGAVAGSVDVTYDNALRLSGIQVNGNSVASLSYDRDGLPVTNGYLLMGYRPDNGLLQSVSAANYTGRWTYDSLAQVGLYAVTYDLTGDSLFRAAYTYDKIGRITQLAERAQSDTATYAYGYDAAGRLATVQKSGAIIAAYTYDLNGNRLQATYPSGNVVGSVDDQDRLLSYGANTYAYTGNGELKLKVTGADSTKYRYDAFGNLRDVYLPTGDHIEYVIDAQQRRIGRKLNGALQRGWLYQSQLAIAAEVDVNGTVTKTFEYATHANVPDWMYANGVPYRIITDHLGSVRLVVDVNGTVAQRIDYDAYGRILVNTNPGFQPFGYAGGLLDDATGLTRFGVRDYDNESGRWTAQDPIGFAGGSSNPYEYVAGSPITTADPDGRFILAIVGGVITYIAERGAGAAPIAALERALISTAVGIVIPFGSAAVLERLIAGGVSSGILNQLFRILLDPCDSIASNTSFSRLVDGAVLGGALAGFGAGIASIGRLAASTRGVYLGQSAFRVLDRLAEFTALNSEGALTAAGIPRRVGHDR